MSSSGVTWRSTAALRQGPGPIWQAVRTPALVTPTRCAGWRRPPGTVASLTSTCGLTTGAKWCGWSAGPGTSRPHGHPREFVGVSVSGRFAVYDSEEPATQYVLDTQTKQVLRTGSLVAASLRGSELWQAIPDQPGRLALTYLPSGQQTTTVEMDAPCVPSEIQAVMGRIYWRCPGEGPAGVYDRTTRRSTPVPGGDSLLGDGYLVHRPDPSTLEIIDFFPPRERPRRCPRSTPLGRCLWTFAKRVSRPQLTDGWPVSRYPIG